MSRIVLLKECSVRKGGHNDKPIRPRPNTPPPGQGGNDMTNIPVSQLLKAHRLIKELLSLKLGKKANNLLEELKDCNTVTY